MAVTVLTSILLGGTVNAADADLQAQYERRAAERYVALFGSLDLDRDASVSRAEAKGDLNFGPRFDDMDINRDGFVTAAELQRFIALEYAIRIEPVQR
jgi:hypothetical protein